MDHPKEIIVQEWLNQHPKATLKDIFAEFAPDLESCVMAATLSNLDMGIDLKTYCRGIPLEDRIETYSPYPLWFKTFIRQDIEHAVKIYRFNKDADDYANNIIEDWVEEDEYINLVKNAEAFPGNQVKMVFKKVTLSNEADFARNISQEFETRISSGEDLEFEDSAEKDLYYFLRLQKFTDVAQADLNAFNELADKFSDLFLIRDVYAKAVISDNYIYVTSTQQIFMYFDIEPKINFDRKGLNKAVLKEMGEQGLDLAEASMDEFVKENLAEIIGGRTYTIGKMLFKLAKKSYEVIDDNVEITFDEQDAQEFYDRFAFSYASGKSLREFFMEEVKIPMQKFYIKKRLDLSQLTDSFFENQYRVFVNTRFYSKMGSLSQNAQEKILAIKDQDKRDTALFVALGKIQNTEDNLTHDLG